jgi:hypothetical protein
LEFVISQKGGLEEGLNNMDPVLKLKWSDCSIGKSSNINMFYERNHFMDYVGNILKEPTTEKLESSYIRFPITMEKISIVLRGYVIILFFFRPLVVYNVKLQRLIS